MILRTSASVSRIVRPLPRQAPSSRAFSRTNLSDQPVASASSFGVIVCGMIVIADPELRRFV
jgi:hypothetical protein